METALGSSCSPQKPALRPSRGAQEMGPGVGDDAPLTYKQGMYTRLPTITSMNSSGEQSSRKSTSALKISVGQVKGEPRPAGSSPTQRGPETPTGNTCGKGPQRASACEVSRDFTAWEPLIFLFKRSHHMSEFRSPVQTSAEARTPLTRVPSACGTQRWARSSLKAPVCPLPQARLCWAPSCPLTHVQ